MEKISEQYCIVPKSYPKSDAVELEYVYGFERKETRDVDSDRRDLAESTLRWTA